MFMKKYFIKAMIIWCLICFIDHVYKYIISNNMTQTIFSFIMSLVLGISTLYWIEEYKELKL